MAAQIGGQYMRRVSDLRTWEAWHNTHQPFELDWWKDALAKGHSVDDAGFEYHWREIRKFAARRGTVLDIGCGPRPPFAPCTVIDPLADKYREITPVHWWNDVIVHARPAEQLIDGLVAETVICWNCIDHAIGWREILDNMVAYGHLGTRYVLATDFHEPFVGHPGFERDEFMHEIDRRFTIVDKREDLGRHVALAMRL